MILSHLERPRAIYLIVALLFIGSLAIYSYSLEGQPWHGDEITYLGWGANYVSLISKGDYGNPCLVTLDNCKDLFHVPAFGLTYSPVRNLFIGLPMYILGADNGNFYNWSCYWDCYHKDEGPSISEMTAGRLLSPFFGAGAVVLVFVIGRKMFGTSFGILASLVLMFYDMWVWYSREIMVEIHYVFFALLSIALLLHSLGGQRIKITYFTASAVVLGFSLNSKLLAVCFAGLFFGIIIINRLSVQSGSGSKRRIGRAALLASSFFLISLLGMFLAEPGFYVNPVEEIKIMKSDMDTYNHDVWYIGYPTTQNLQPKSLHSLFQFAVFPSFLEDIPSGTAQDQWGSLGWTYPPTYSSVPMTVFFFAGLGFLSYRIWKSRNLMANEMLLLLWLASTVVLTLVIVKDFSLERYLLPLEVSVIFISCYGLWSFLQRLQGNKMRVAIAALFVFAHSTTSLLYLDKIYFSPGTMWVNPLHYGTLQESMDNPLTLAVNAVFVIVLASSTVSILRKYRFQRYDINNKAGQDLKR